MYIVFCLIFLFSIPAFILGMIVPRVYGRFFKKGVTRGKLAKAFGMVMFGSLILTIATAPPVEPKPETEVIAESAKIDEAKPVENTPVPTETKVIKVVDGDTVRVETDGVEETIRIIGINTPETVDPRKPVECFGQEASNKAKELLDGQSVRLEADVTQGERDKYGRLLRYVFLENGTDFGKWMISQGFSFEYRYAASYKYEQDYKTAQVEAQTAKRGLWADGACEDATDDSAASVETTTDSTATTSSADPEPTTETTTVSPEATTTTTTQQPAPPAATASCSCTSNSYNCSNFSTHAQAQAVYECCMDQVGSDVHKLDGSDNDGLACETLP